MKVRVLEERTGSGLFSSCFVVRADNSPRINLILRRTERREVQRNELEPLDLASPEPQPPLGLLCELTDYIKLA